MKILMKINSEDLWKYVNELATNEKVKFNVYYDDKYVTQMYWNGKSFEWEPGTFTSEAFFNPLYDFVVIEEEKKIPEKLDYLGLKIREGNLSKQDVIMLCDYIDYQTQTINLLIDYLKSKGDE